MKYSVVIIAALLCCLDVQAYTNFISNPHTPYPAGCTYYVDYNGPWESAEPKAKVFEGRLPLLISAANLDTQSDVIVRVYRLACADPNRSVIWLQFTMPADQPQSRFYVAPTVRAVFDDGKTVAMGLAPEPNSWDTGTWPRDYPHVFGFNNCEGNGNFCTEYGWYFVLDNAGPLSDEDGVEDEVSPSQYNDRLRLELNWHGNDPGYFIDVPATSDIFAGHFRLALSGRLSGNWVIDGAADQGIVMAVSEIPQEFDAFALTSNLLMFLSWYTYDSRGDPIWLTGAAQFSTGTSQATLAIELVTDGEFLSNKTADRRVVGSVTITGNNCNDLGFEYDLTGIGLGTGSKHLQRLFSLETAGYTCRDLEARLQEE